MENIYVLETALNLYSDADDLAKDWLIKSWSLKDEDKIIALAYYQKACKRRKLLAKRLCELSKGGDY
jgi:hypothetical protein